MTTHWIECQPADKDSAAMLEFILAKVQKVKLRTYEEIVTGKRRGSKTPRSEWRDALIRLLLSQDRVLYDVPRYALQVAVDSTLDYAKEPDKKLDWQSFSVEPRDGWQKQAKPRRQSVTWENYISGKTSATSSSAKDNRVVKPDKALQELLEYGLVSFKWARIVLSGNFLGKLEKQMLEEKVEEEDFLKRTEAVKFCKFGEKKWKVQFILEEK